MGRLTLWDNMRFEAFLPTTIFLFLCFPIGVFGNGVVIYIYGFRLHRKYAGRYFIPYLAVADLFAVFISVELHVVNNFYPVTNKLETLCKWNFVAGFYASVFSAYVLLTIAVQRYLKVCKPFKGQMTLFWRRFALCLSCSHNSSCCSNLFYIWIRESLQQRNEYYRNCLS